MKAELIPPQNLDAEQSVLGSMMIEQKALHTGLEMLTAGDFYRPVHQEVFDCFSALAERDEPCDLRTLQEELRSRSKLEDSGGTEYLMALVDAVPTAANIRHYAGIVRKHATQRRAIDLGTELISLGYEADLEEKDLREVVVGKALEFSAEHGDSAVRPISDVVTSVWNQVDRAFKGEKPPHIPFRLEQLTQLTGGGMRAGDLVIFAADTGQGKTVCETECLIEAAKLGEPVIFFSCEMIAEEAILRVLCSLGWMDSMQVRHGHADFDRLKGICGEVYNWPVHLVDATVTLRDLQVKTRRWAIEHRKDRLGLVVVDYAQLVVPDRVYESENVAQAQTLRGLKWLARDLKLPVLTACQFRKRPVFSRTTLEEERPDTLEKVKWPVLEDLFGTTETRAAPDVVIIIVNPEELDDRSDRRKAFFRVAKCRNGRLGAFMAWFTPAHARFDPITERYGDPGRAA